MHCFWNKFQPAKICLFEDVTPSIYCGTHYMCTNQVASVVSHWWSHVHFHMSIWRCNLDGVEYAALQYDLPTPVNVTHSPTSFMSPITFKSANMFFAMFGRSDNILSSKTGLYLILYFDKHNFMHQNVNKVKNVPRMLWTYTVGMIHYESSHFFLLTLLLN